MRVLVCEDSEAIASLVMLYIKEDSHEALYAANGEQALEILTHKTIDLIIIGVEMPGKNGFEITAEIRQRYPEWIPIIFLSANHNEDSLAKGIEAGGDDYLFKPIPPVILKAKIRAMARLADMRKELTSLNKELEKISITDSLTNLINRRGFEAIAQKQWQESKRNIRCISVFMIDIDHFKLYNDNYGHPRGDECLKLVSQAIKSALTRPLDTVARMGGEEFAVLLVDTDSTGAQIVAQRILDSINALYLEHSLSPTCPFVTVSIGLVSSDDPNQYDIYELLDAADKALYHSKENGRNQFSCGHTIARKRIFVVDDDYDILSLYRSVLGQRWNVYTFNKAGKCIERAYEVVPDLMLVDIMMEEIDGYEVAKLIRSHHSTRDVPIIFISSLKKETLLLKAKDMGVNAYIRKPIDIDKLYHKVESFL